MNVIVDKNIVDDRDEENFVELEVTGDDRLHAEAIVPAFSPPAIGSSEQTEHGHLVEQILETQKELEGPFVDKKTGKIEIV